MAGKMCANFGSILEIIRPRGEVYKFFIHVKVRINISEPLLHSTQLRWRDRTRKWIAFKYERLLGYYFLCGFIGHMEKKCQLHFEDGFVHPGKVLPYGEWLKAPLPGSSNPIQRTVFAPVSVNTRLGPSQPRQTGLSIFQFRNKATLEN